MTAANGATSSRWIVDFEKQVMRGKHVLLYGNVHDQFLWAGQYVSSAEFVESYFLDKGFKYVLQFDQVDGFSFARPEMKRPFEDLVQQRASARWNIGISGNDAVVPQPPQRPDPNNRVAPPRQLPQPASANRQKIQLDDAFSRIRLGISQSEHSVAVIVNLGDMLTSDAARYGGDEREPIAILKKCTLEAGLLIDGPLAGYRNTLVITAGDFRRVPEWFYRENPFLSLVQATRPRKEERRQFATSFLRPSGEGTGFFGGDKLNEDCLNALAEEFADRTDGLQAWDLEALRRTSWVEQIPVTELRRLIDFFKFGLREDPWEQLNADKIANARIILSRRVKGQPQALEAVTSMLTSARVGLSIGGGATKSGRPKGIFFFVGPTGVGKTELAKAVTELVFGDERAFARFDMSEYKEEHAAEKLAGAPPGFVGYEEGGQLTNRVLEQPHSILLFDEIEKAHPRVLDKFLQILEDGRLTDGKGQTAYFNQTAIIFTSNIGASELIRRTQGHINECSYEAVADHFRREVETYFTEKIARAELLNRLGDSIVAFDLLRPDFVKAIGEKFLVQLRAGSLEKYRLDLLFDASVLEFVHSEMQQGDNLLFGGRRVKTLLESAVERPLNRWIFEKQPGGVGLSGRCLSLSMARGQLQVAIAMEASNDLRT